VIVITLDVSWEYITIIFTYSITMAARPIGSAVFGHYSGKLGRHYLLVFTIGGVGRDCPGSRDFLSSAQETKTSWTREVGQRKHFVRVSE
jgi:MFS family permease